MSISQCSQSEFFTDNELLSIYSFFVIIYVIIQYVIFQFVIISCNFVYTMCFLLYIYNELGYIL